MTATGWKPRPTLLVSVNNPRQLSLYATLLESCRELTSSVELFWDNFCHLDPRQVLGWIEPVTSVFSLHVMWSRFIDAPADVFHEFLRTLSRHVAIYRPLYVSDHVARFTTASQLHSYVALERGYDFDELIRVADRVNQYQDAIGGRLLLENFASTTPAGSRQVQYFESLQARTGCGILFDISNARVAELNGYETANTWRQLLRQETHVHCHIGGYAYWRSDSQYHDTHDSALTAGTLRDLSETLLALPVETICYERDYNKSLASMRRDLALIDRELRPWPISI